MSNINKETKAPRCLHTGIALAEWGIWTEMSLHGGHQFRLSAREKEVTYYPVHVGPSVTWCSDSRPSAVSPLHLPPSLACEQVLAKTVRWHWTPFCFDNHCLPYPRYCWWFLLMPASCVFTSPRGAEQQSASRVSSGRQMDWDCTLPYNSLVWFGQTS